MSKGVKIFLIILGVCFVGFVAVVVAGALWFNANKDSLKAEFKAGVEEMSADAQQFAQAADQNQCLEEALRRSNACTGFSPVCETKAGVFGRLCLNDAREVPGLCEGVPAPNAIVDTVTWSMKRCVDHAPMPADKCQRVFQSLQKYCHDR